MARFVGWAEEGVATASAKRAMIVALGGYLVVWTLYQCVSLSTVDLRLDASEVALWAQHLALGYKHPPMTAWLFAAWFAVFPRADWAAHLAAVVVAVITLGITWRLALDYLDKDRAVLGIAALVLIPLCTFKTAELNANTVMMPFWAATIFFFLRARRGCSTIDAVLAGAFAGFTMLGKYWAVYLFAGLAVASVVGPGTRRFWRSLSPYAMAVTAVIVLMPHVYWYLSQRGGTSYEFLRDSVLIDDSFVEAAGVSIRYWLGCIAWSAGPLIVLAALRPSRAALVDTVWPADGERRRAVILFLVPLVLPGFVNLALPHRLTSDWTYPNWALLPIVLFGSRKIAIDTKAATLAGLAAVALSVGALLISPAVAYDKLRAGFDHNRPEGQEITAVARGLGATPIQYYAGSAELTAGLTFYAPTAHPLEAPLLSAAGLAAIAAEGLTLVCLETDAKCLHIAALLADSNTRSTDAVIRHFFLGIAGPPLRVRVMILPPAAATVQ